MVALPLGLFSQLYLGPQIIANRFLDDDTLPIEMGYIPTIFSERDLVHLVRVNPDLALSAI